jgi:UDPglucose 6-dehydrogenase
LSLGLVGATSCARSAARRQKCADEAVNPALCSRNCAPAREFSDAAPEALGRLVQTRRIVDGRHALDSDTYRAAGWEYRALGQPSQGRTATLARA